MLAGAVIYAQRLSSHHFTLGRVHENQGQPGSRSGTTNCIVVNAIYTKLVSSTLVSSVSVINLDNG